MNQYTMNFIADAPFAETNERAFEVTDEQGRVSTIAVLLVETAVDFDKDGKDDVIHCEVFGRLIDTDTNETALVGNRPVKVGPHTVSLYMSEAEDNNVDIDDWIAGHYEKCVPRIMNRKQTLLSRAQIPKAA